MLSSQDPSIRGGVSERMRERYKLGADVEREDDADNLYKLLISKDSDLILAAELGSALLIKNEEISKQRETMVVEYTQKLEVSFLNLLSIVISFYL